MSKPYSLSIRSLNKIFHIKSFSVQEQREAVEILIEAITQEKEITHTEYREIVVNYLLCSDVEQDFGGIAEEDKRGVIDLLYSNIIKHLYPAFRAEQVSLMQRYKVAKNVLDIEDEEFDSILFGDGMEFTDVADLDYSLEELNAMEDRINSRLIGQEEAVAEVMSGVKRLTVGITGHQVYLLAGRTGRGKTYLGKLLGEELGYFKKFECASYSSGHEHNSIIGAPPGYAGHAEVSEIAKMAEESSQWVLVFDEIEKADPKFYNFLLNLLDEGSITDANGVECDFTDSIILLTTNKGVQEAESLASLGFGQSFPSQVEEDTAITTSLENFFSPEFMNRIDEVIVFNNFSAEHILQIVKVELMALPVRKTPALVKHVASKAYSEKYGARGVKRWINKHIAGPIADAKLSKRKPLKGKLYTFKTSASGLEISNMRP